MGAITMKNKDKNQKRSNLYDWAMFYHEKWGAAVIPLKKGKIPAVRWAGFQRQRPSLDDYKQWFIDRQPWGVAIVCGAVSGNLVRLDFDDPADYEELKDRLPKGAPVFRSQRPGGGYGVILRSTAPVPKLPEGTFERYLRLGINGEGSITVVPPTPGYKWLTQCETVPAVDVEGWLKNQVGYELRRRGKRLAELAGATDGQPLAEMGAK